MAPVYQTTPRKDGKTQEQADKDMETHVGTYYITDEERTFDGAGDTSAAPPSVPKPKAKRPARKESPKPKTTSKTEEAQSSSLTRKSARVASKRAASDMQTSDAVDEEKQQQPAKKVKMSPPQKTKKRAAADSSNSEEDEQQPPASKRIKMTGPAPTAKKTVATPSKAKTTVSPSKISKAPSGSSTVQKTTTGRPAPISKELPKAKYVEKKSTATAPATEDADDETEIEDDADEEEEPSPQSGKGKDKKPAVKAFQGTKSGFGTSVEKPENAPLDQPWKCANRDCNSGQTYHPRDGPNSFGRKVISNFFGRNKKETNLIEGDVWHNYCRKCYQRGTYRVNVISNLEKVKYYISNIEMQLDRIELWRPGATFTVQLSKGAGDRLRKYYKERTKQGATAASAQAAVTKIPQTNAKGKVKPLSLEDAFPADLLEYFEDNFVADNQSFLDLKLVLNWVRGLAENGQIDSMPPMEFLIKQQTEDETIVDPTTNYQRWCAHEDGVDFNEEDGEDEDASQVEEDLDDAETVDAGDDDAESTELAEDDLDDTKKTGEGADPAEDAGSEDIPSVTSENGNDSSIDGTTGEGEKVGSAGKDTNETDGARSDDAESGEESDHEVRDAIKSLSQDAVGYLTKGVVGTTSTPLNTDFYDDGEEYDEEEYDEEGYDEEEIDEPQTPPPPASRPWRLTPTGRGSPIKMGQSSTAYITRDVGPASPNMRKRSYASGDYNDSSSSESSPPTKLDTSATTYTGPDASTAFKRKREIEEDVANRNYNDTESEGESSPSKKQKL